jgi:hypothetical protein
MYCGAIGIEVHEGRLVAVHRCERGFFHGEPSGGESAQLRVLLPEVGFDELRGREELQNGDIASRQPASGGFTTALRKQILAAQGGGTGNRGARRESTF